MQSKQEAHARSRSPAASCSRRRPRLGHVVNENGEVIKTVIKPGTRVRVYYINMGDSRVVDHVVVE